MKNWSKDLQGWPSNFSEVGKVWTKLGLSMGKAAMQGSAEALRKTAEVLDQFSAMLPVEPEDKQDVDQDNKPPSAQN